MSDKFQCFTKFFLKLRRRAAADPLPRREHVKGVPAAGIDVSLGMDACIIESVYIIQSLAVEWLNIPYEGIARR